MIVHVKAAENFAAERYGIDFGRIFLIMVSKNWLRSSVE